MQRLALLFALSLPGMFVAQAAGQATALDRVIGAAEKAPEWKNARTQVERLGILRKQALKYAPVSDLVSDRYLITALAGPVDLVRFFGLARTVCGGAPRRAALLKEWKREGGDQLKAGIVGDTPVELSPDDLPSNALGALFGEELKPHNTNVSHDLATDLRSFLGNLDPVADSVTTSLPQVRLVEGLEPNPTPEAKRASVAWLTAEPLYLLPVVAPDKAKTFVSAAVALKAAGMEVRSHEGHPIIIERVGTPEPDTTKYVKAVPVVERYPKAVPVKEQAVPTKPKVFPKAVPVE